MIYKPIALSAAALCVAMLSAGAAFTVPAMGAPGDPLVVSPFVSTGYNNWIDVIRQIGPYPVDDTGNNLLGGYTKEDGTKFTGGQGYEQNWGIQIRDGALNEASDGHPGVGASTTTDYLGYMMVQNQYVTPSQYTFTTRMYSYDDDGFGVIFGYQDPYNMFRVGIREQAGGSLGFDSGLHVSRIVNGQIMKLAQTNSLGVNGLITDDATNLTTSNYRNAPHGTAAQPLDVTVVVNGNNWQVKMAKNGVPLIYDNGAGTTSDVLLSGVDDNLAPGKVGVQSWYALQESNSAAAAGNMQCGVEFETVNVDAVGTPGFHDDFNLGAGGALAASPVRWSVLTMKNSAGFIPGKVGSGLTGDDPSMLGNFRLQVNDGTIEDDSNGFTWATTAAANVDFLGPAIIVTDKTGTEADPFAMTDYEMKFRLENGDNDGGGALVRVQPTDAEGDNTFYRINFTAEAIGTTEQRTPQGMSIQKVKNGVWSELYRESQAVDEQLFLPANDVPFDVKVTVVGNTITVQVIDGSGNVINYAPVVDASDPILSGTVGFHQWGSGDVNDGLIWSDYGGQQGAALVTVAIPEPTSLVLLGLLAVCGLGVRRRG